MSQMITKNKEMPSVTPDPLFKLLCHSIDNIILCLSAKYNIIEVNPVCESIFGQFKKQLLNKNLYVICKRLKVKFPLSKDLFKGPKKEILHDICCDITTNDNKKHYPITWTVSKLRNTRNRVYGIILIGKIIDIPSTLVPSKKEISLDNKDKEIHLLKNVISKLPGHIYWKDTNGVYLGSNEGNIISAGLASPNYIIGKTDYDLPWKDEADSFRKIDLKVMKTGNPYVQEETGTLHNGTQMTVLSQKVPLRDEKGNIIGIIGNSVDITDLKQTQIALQIAKEKAEQANQAKSNFLATISHELRTPLSGILGMAQVLHNEKLTLAQRKQLNVILRSGNHLLNLIDDILDFSKLEAGKLEMIYEEFNLHQLIKDIVSDVYQLLLNKDIKSIIEYDSNTSRKIIADSSRVQQIIINFISNAIKFTTKGYIKIIVKSDKRSKRLKISVRDTGIGIPKNKQNLLFQRFMQLDSKYSRRFTGAGLGLAISKQLVETMGGTIGADSKYRKGSTFWFTLPLTLKVSPKKLIKKIKPSLDDGPIKPTYILLLEDNLVNQEVTKVMLENLGCPLDIVDNGKEALKMFKKHDYGMIISDISLPGMSGIEVIQKIRAQETGNKHIPIIALTAHVLEEDQKNCLDAGANEVLTKPIMQSDLKTTLLKWIK